jgi:N-acetyl-gamma-glutamylphosphate reductase
LNRTGATGYIGGEALYAINKKHPDFSFSVLVRDTSKNDTIKAAFPSVRIVNGELDDFDLLKKEAADADIVVRTSLPISRLCKKDSVDGDVQTRQMHQTTSSPPKQSPQV